MKIFKFVMLLFITSTLANYGFGAGWRSTREFAEWPYWADAGKLGITTDTHYIHIASALTDILAKCVWMVYFNSVDGILWGNLNNIDTPEQPIATANTRPSLISNRYGIHALWYKTTNPRGIIRRSSSDYGVTWRWQDWQKIGEGSPTVAATTINHIGYAVWSHARITNEPYNSELYYKKSDSGQDWWSYVPDPLDSAQRITFAGGRSIFSDISANTYGLHLVWADNRLDPTSPTEYEIYYKYSTDGGQTWWPEDDEPLTINRPDSSFYPAIATYNNGVHVVFQDKRYEMNQIFYKRSLDNGQTWNEDEYVIADGINPDISADRDGLHVVYEYGDEIYYRQSRDFGNTWLNPVNISFDQYESKTPKIAVDFRGRHIVWMKLVANYGPIMYRQYDILPPAAPTNFRIEYIAHNGGISLYFAWDASTEPDLAGYNMYRRPIDIPHYIKINQELITRNSYRDIINYGESYCYYVTAVDLTENESGRSNIVTFLSPDYETDIGIPEPSVNLIERDGYIQWENNSAKTVDVDNSQLVYRFTNLNLNSEYEIGFVYYRGDNEERIQTVEVDGVELQEIEVPSSPEMYVFQLSQSSYADGEIYVHIEKLFGPNVVLSEIYLWEFDVGGGGQSGGKTGLNQFGLTLSPNIFKNSTTISYELPLQSNISLKVYNSSGKLVRTLVNELATKKKNQFQWDGKDEQNRNVPAGVYIVRLSVDDNITTKQLLVVR